MTDTLKSICEQCIHLKTPKLEFIPVGFARHRQVILRDPAELVSAATKNHEKTVVILSGCVLESVLFSFIQSQEAYITSRRGNFTFNPDRSVDNFVSIFNRWFRDILPGVVLPDLMVDYRDLVHINRELNAAEDICESASRDMLRIVDRLLGELNQFADRSNAPPSQGQKISDIGQRLWKGMVRLWNWVRTVSRMELTSPDLWRIVVSPTFP